MGKLSQLLKWNKTILLKNDQGVPLKDENKKPVYVTVRLLGDKDLEDASRQARISSALKRINLLDEDSDDYKDMVKPFDNTDRSYCLQMILAGEGANWSSEALSEVERPDDVKLEEVSVDPDAPSLEELEKLDRKNKTLDEDYKKKLQEFVKSRQEILFAQLEDKSDEEVKEKAKESIVIVATIEEYMNRLLDEKVWRSVYSGKEMTEREFSNMEEFQSLVTVVKNQLRTAYMELEEGASEVKN